MNYAGICLENASAGFHDKYKAEWDDELGYTAYEISRSVGVRAVGVIGGMFLGGPVGAFFGGLYGGTAVDIGATFATKRTQGILRDIENIVNDCKCGEFPTRNAFISAVQIASDGVNGMVMSNAVGSAESFGGVMKQVGKESLKISAGKATRTVVKVYM